VLPAVAVAVTAAALIAYVMTAGGSGAGSGQGGPGAAVLWSVIGSALLLVCGVFFAATRSASAHARTVLDRQTALRRSLTRGHHEVRALIGSIEQGERPQPRPLPELPEPGPEADAFELLAYQLAQAQHSAETSVSEAAALVRSSASGSEEKVEVFVNLARRLQSLVHREIELLDELENEVEDPDLLKGLFHVDHLATRIRRHAENLAVLGGAVSRRQWSRPVTMTEVLRSSIAEVEHYPRVKLVPPIEGTLRGHAVADVIHLLAELVENATVFSAPQTQVLLRAQHVTAGLAIEVDDRGLGMPAEEQRRMNAVLSDPERIDVGELLRDGRIGLFVVSALAQRHGIVVQLQSNIYGGIQAVLVLPRELLGDDPAAGQTGAVADSGKYLPSQTAGGAGQAAIGGRAVQADQAQRVQAGHGASGAAYPQEYQASALNGTPNGSSAAASASASSDSTVPSSSYGPSSPHALPQARQHPSTEPQLPLPVRQSGQENLSPAPESRSPHGSLPRWPVPGAEVPGPPHEPPGERPELPKRRRQEHLVPELRDEPPARNAPEEAEWDAAAQGHDPGLMAAFQRGATLAQGTDLAQGADGTGAAGGGTLLPGTAPAPGPGPGAFDSGAGPGTSDGNGADARRPAD
jgi:signal transduction histidine kinase